MLINWIDASNVVQRTSPYLLKILRHKQREIQTGLYNDLLLI